MVDVAPNHMASDNTAETIDYGLLNPFNEESYFHSICWITDWNNQTEVEIVRITPCPNTFGIAALRERSLLIVSSKSVGWVMMTIP
jgi:hypothetical protein